VGPVWGGGTCPREGAGGFFRHLTFCSDALFQYGLYKYGTCLDFLETLFTNFKLWFISRFFSEPCRCKHGTCSSMKGGGGRGREGGGRSKRKKAGGETGRPISLWSLWPPPYHTNLNRHLES